jgi:hypothetical protein
MACVSTWAGRFFLEFADGVDDRFSLLAHLGADDLVIGVVRRASFDDSAGTPRLPGADALRPRPVRRDLRC